MAHDPAAQRRRAVVGALSGVLDEASLMQALWLAQESLRGEQVSDIIRYIDAVASRNMIDAATCRRLYNELYKLMRESEDRLPLDPWPAMQATRAPAPAPAYAPAFAPAYAPRAMPAPPPAQWQPPPMAAPAPYYPAAQVPPGYPGAAMPPPGYAPPGYPAPVPMYAEVPAAPAVAAPVAPPAPAPIAIEPPVIFGAVMREVVREVFSYHREALEEVQRDALRSLGRSRATPALQQRFREALGRARQDDWQLQGSHGDLAELSRVMFVALTEAFGRVGADQILQRALTKAEELPEARQFSPKRLLAAM
ncbi:hypothetical protein Lcho_1831 [Leptothrix cholodnii SP-6]|uniref:Uncharacterized protein n=1 Tax=Leptothrix cholodnii (strain ATCC 51168 / LMG 8142 / SP-6) TaxID=395495 RepID=B1XZX1_LEPCP|nr:hypothetical protein [Leptothrix cholodnii]ACB34098.1 hypothetical protein Lcho_1831 [Leptothrix cholodnii SP-6]